MGVGVTVELVVVFEDEFVGLLEFVEVVELVEFTDGAKEGAVRSV